MRRSIYYLVMILKYNKKIKKKNNKLNNFINGQAKE